MEMLIYTFSGLLKILIIALILYMYFIIMLTYSVKNNETNERKANFLSILCVASLIYLTFITDKYLSAIT